MSEYHIELADISKDYAMGEVTVRALRGLSLGIRRGQFVVVLGPSGCGKTTTLNLVGALDRPTGGSIVVDGQKITAQNDTQRTRYRRERVGFVFQFFNLIPTLTAQENVELVLALAPSREPRGGRARELLRLVGLEERAGHFPAQLSGGEQQRVAIARALANRPTVLLCDEPMGNLDLETGVQVLGAIRDLNRREGATVILVTHNTAIAPVADRVVRLRSGAIESDNAVSAPIDVARVSW